MSSLKKIIVKLLRETADKIDANTSEITEEEAMEIMRVVAHESLSKEQACKYLNVKSSRFGDLIREKKIPKGRKVTGFKELRWYKDEIDEYIRKKHK